MHEDVRTWVSDAGRQEHASGVRPLTTEAMPDAWCVCRLGALPRPCAETSGSIGPSGG